MHFRKEGEWTVSTPLLAGGGEGVQKALTCAHLSWREETRAVEQGKLMVMERCTACVFATRVKFRDATPKELGAK